MKSSRTERLALLSILLGVLSVIGLFLLPALWPTSVADTLGQAIGVYGQICMFALGAAGAGTATFGARHIGTGAPTSAMGHTAVEAAMETEEMP